MKLITEQKDLKSFACAFSNETAEFAEHVYRIGCQFKARKELRSSLHQGYFYVQKDFAEDLLHKKWSFSLSILSVNVT